MSVPKSKRKTSQLEYYHNALKMRKEITNLLFRDFGIKPVVKECRFKIKQENKFLVLLFKIYIKLFYALFKNDVLTPKVQLKYPQWFIECEQKNINQYLTTFMDAIELLRLHGMTRKNIEVALDNCYLILKELQFVITITSLRPNKIALHVGLIKKEIDLLEDYFNRCAL